MRRAASSQEETLPPPSGHNSRDTQQRDGIAIIDVHTPASLIPLPSPRRRPAGTRTIDPSAAQHTAQHSSPRLGRVGDGLRLWHATLALERGRGARERIRYRRHPARTINSGKIGQPVASARTCGPVGARRAHRRPVKAIRRHLPVPDRPEARPLRRSLTFAPNRSRASPPASCSVQRTRSDPCRSGDLTRSSAAVSASRSGARTAFSFRLNLPRRPGQRHRSSPCGRSAGSHPPPSLPAGENSQAHRSPRQARAPLALTRPASVIVQREIPEHPPGAEVIAGQ